MGINEERSGRVLERLAPDRPSLWWAGLAAALLAVGFRRRSRSETRTTGAANGGRGRAATAPSEIPVRGWKDIFWRVYAGISESRLIAIAAGVTFYALLAI